MDKVLPGKIFILISFKEKVFTHKLTVNVDKF